MNGVQKTIKYCAIAFGIFLIVNIVCGLLSLFGYVAHFNEETKDFKENFSNINSLEIDLCATNLTIRRGEIFSVTATSISENTKIKQTGNSLKIEEDNWLWSNGKNGEIIITVPTELQKVDIDTGAGKVVINDLNATKIDLDTGAGEVEINNSSFYETKIDGGVGKLAIQNSTMNDLDLDMGVGEVYITARITGNSSISGGVGRLDIHLIGTSNDYTINAEKGIGSLKLDGMDIDNTQLGNGINKIKIEGGIGEINISLMN